MKKSELIFKIELLLRRAKFGCSNLGCKISPPKGIGTCALCSCCRDLRKKMQELAEEIDDCIERDV